MIIELRTWLAGGRVADDTGECLAIWTRFTNRVSVCGTISQHAFAPRALAAASDVIKVVGAGRTVETVD